jgi:hypothetical protein
MALTRIRATVTVSAPVASVTVSASGAIGTTVGVTQAAVTRAIPIAAVKWINIVYSVEVDYRGLNPVLSEITVVADTSALLVSKPFRESQSAVDELQPFVINKGIEENLPTTELVVYDYRKTLADSVDATDDLFGEANIDDDQVMFLVKGSIPEHLSVSDTDDILFGKNLDEQKSVIDSDPDFDVSKQVDDQADISEVVGVDYQKPISDQVDAGDEINGVVQSDDGQTFFMQTSRSDSASVSDLYAPDFGKNPSDSLASTDEVDSLVVNKSVTDSADTTEQHTSSLSKPASDTASASESAAINLGLATKFDTARSQNEGPNIIEDYASVGYFAEQYAGNGGPKRDIGKTLQDVWTVSDAQTVSAGKDLTDTASTSESQTFNTTKALADTANATDDFDGAASIEDDQVMQFVSSRSETAHTSDIHVPLVGKGLADSASTGDSGSLRMTDYCDVNYFTESYVGTSLTF